VSVPGELERARRLAFAADEIAARDLLLSLVPLIEDEDRDDLMLEVLAQLGEIYLARGADDGVRESIRRIRDCLAIYSGIAAGTMPDAAAQMLRRYTRRAQFLEAGLAAAQGDHDRAAAALATLGDLGVDGEDDGEHADLLTHAQILCGTALCDDDLHVRSVPLWEQVLSALQGPAQPGGNPRIDSQLADYVRIAGATAYGRFCVETGRLPEAEPWLRRAEARAQANGWELATARAQLERAAACWSARDQAATEQLSSKAYPVIARYARAHDVSRCWLYLGLTRMAAGALEAADQCWEHAERHWRELGKPLHIHRILLQRSWIAIFRGRFADAVELIAQAREWLDSSPRSSWLQYAQLDNHLGTAWRADALADLGLDAAGDPSDTWREVEARQANALGITRAHVGSPQYLRAATKLEQAAELKLPAALAVDSVRYSIAGADARSRWANRISAPLMAGAFAVAWEWDNTELISELIEYHSARGTFSTEPQAREAGPEIGEWAATATTPVLLETEPVTPVVTAVSLTRLGPLPPLRMQPDAPPIMSHYRALASQRYGRDVTAREPAWSTWP
jgi:tetratricopeptide (TPR) repeat protein